MLSIRLMMLAGVGAVAIAAPCGAEIAVGESAVGVLETMPPEPGTLVVPESATVAPITLNHSGATDADSAVATVQLYYRTDSTPWQASGLENATVAGVFDFGPPGASPANHGLYYFDVVAIDTLGNASPAPEGIAGEGQGATLFGGSSVGEWWVLQ